MKLETVEIAETAIRDVTSKSRLRVKKFRGVGRSINFFQLALADGRLPHKKIGSARCWSVEDFDRMIEAETQADLERRGIAKPKQAAESKEEWTDRAKSFQAVLSGTK